MGRARALSAPRVLVVGDVINDILVETAGPVVDGADNRAVIRARPGGSAANQAAWLGWLGVDVVFAGRAGAVDVELHRRELARFGVRAHLAADPAAATGSIVVLVGADGERTMITDRGANLRLQPADVPAELLDGVDLLHLTGYSLVAPGPRAVVRQVMAEAAAREVPFGIDPGSAAFLRELAPGRSWSGHAGRRSASRTAMRPRCWPGVWPVAWPVAWPVTWRNPPRRRRWRPRLSRITARSW